MAYKQTHSLEGGMCNCPMCTGEGRLQIEGDSVLIARDPSEASVDGQGGTLRGNPVFTVDQAAFYLNRGDGLITFEGVTYGTGANWDGAKGFDNDWYFTAAGKANGGKAVSNGQPGNADLGVADGALNTINFGFYETLATLPEPYVFRNTSGNLQLGLGVAQGFSQFSDAQKAATREAMASWDDLIAVTFVETHFSQGDINFMNTTTGPAQASAYLPYDYGVSSTKNFEGKGVSFYEISGDVYVATPSKNASNGLLDEGQYGLTTLIHEVGHSLGLEHPGDYNFAPGFAVTYDNGADYYQDSNQYSIMSYWDAEETGAARINWELLTYLYPSTPMVHDVAAIQRIYGADMTTRTGDTTYGFNVTDDTKGRDSFDFTLTPLPVMTIWDAGGNDTLDVSGFNTPSVINLNPGSFSSAGGFYDETMPTLQEINDRRALAGLAPRSQATYDVYKGLVKGTYNNGLLSDNIGIAYGAVIENAKTGIGNDRIIASDVVNILDGGAGFDTVSYEGATSGLTWNFGTMTRNGAAAGDKYINIEAFAGTNLVDKFTGSNNADFLSGNGGNDVIDGGNGNDVLNGDGGDDTIKGGNGADKIDGGADNDTLDGGNDADTVNGGKGNDTVKGGGGDDTLNGGAGNDTLDGGGGFDKFVFGDAGTDTINAFQKGEIIDLSAFGVFEEGEVNVVGNKIFVELDGVEGIGANDLTIIINGASASTAVLVFAEPVLV